MRNSLASSSCVWDSTCLPTHAFSPWGQEPGVILKPEAAGSQDGLAVVCAVSPRGCIRSMLTTFLCSGARWYSKRLYTCSLKLLYHPLRLLKKFSCCLLVFDQGAQNTQNAANSATFTRLSSTKGGSAGMVTTQPKIKELFKNKIKTHLVVWFKLSATIICQVPVFFEQNHILISISAFPYLIWHIQESMLCFWAGGGEGG